MAQRKRKFLIPIIIIVVIIIAFCAVFAFLVFHDKVDLSSADIESASYVNECIADIRESSSYLEMDSELQLNTMLEAINNLGEEGYIDAETITVDKENGLITYVISSGILAGEKIGEYDENIDEIQNNDCSWKSDLRFTYKGSEKNTDAIILNGMTCRDEVMDKCVSLAKKWSSAGVNTYLDRSVTLDDLCNLRGYEFVYVKMHGSNAKYKYKKYALGILGYESITTSYIHLEQKQNADIDKKYESDLLEHRIGYLNGRYFITPGFFNAHYEQHDLGDSIFFLGSCELMGKDGSLTEAWTYALQNASVRSFVGFHNSNYTFDNLDLVEVFMDSLINGETTQTSFDNALAACGKNDEEWRGVCEEGHIPAYPLLRGDGSATLCWERVSGNGYTVEEAYEEPESEEPSWSIPTSLTENDTFLFGEYGGQEIEWRVLDKTDDGILVISEYGIDCKPYNNEAADVTWEACSLREWLNNDFYNTAFSEEEQAMIAETTVTADSNPLYDINPGNDTQDKVFLLSYNEVYEYFASDAERQCKPTDYAVSNGVFKYENDNCCWWLRSPGSNADCAAVVDEGGFDILTGTAVYDDRIAVRPALWINFES